MTLDVVFIHSTGLGPFMWNACRQAVQAALPGARVHTPVNLGYAPGRELARPQPATLADELDALCSQLPAMTDGVHLVGHSYGGLVALELALSGRVPVRSLYLYEPVLFASLRAHVDDIDPEAAADVRAMAGDEAYAGDDAQGGGDAWLQGFVDYWNGAGAWSAMPGKTRDAMRRVGWKMHQEVRAVTTQTRPFADYALPVPAVIVHGGRTKPAAREMARLLAQALPLARERVLADLGHMGVVQRPEEVAADVVQHLRQVG